MKEIYLDYAATTPLDPRVREEMEPYWDKEFGNPSSLHALGVRAKDALGRARKSIASILNARPEEIIFTGSGTEAANLALFGVLRSRKTGHIVSTSIEHHAVLESVRALGEKGYALTLVLVDEYGLVRPDEVFRALRKDTLLVAVMYANNEIGTIEPIADIGKRIKRFKKENGIQPNDPPYFFTDACQAAGYCSLDVQKLGVDMLALNASKIYGPKGVGALFVRKGILLAPIIYGGGQEYGLRSGTENVPGVVGLAAALEIANSEREKESARVSELRDYFIGELKTKFPESRIHGHLIERLANNVSVSFQDIEGDALVFYLGEKGIFASTGSACSSVSLEPSHVLRAIKCPNEFLHGSVRFTLGRATEEKDIDRAIAELAKVLSILQKK